jgi:signal transduction histidine kinase/ActR/RegA family two-component response regulator
MRRWLRPVLGGLLVISAGLSAVAWESRRQTEQRGCELQRETNLVARQFKDRLQFALDEHLIALSQIAAFFENSASISEASFDGFAASTMKRAERCLRLVYVDDTLHVRWVYPPGPNRSLVGFDVRTHPEGYQALLRAKATKDVVLSPPLQLVGGGQGFILAAPIFRDSIYLGQVVCTFRTADFFSDVILPDLRARYDLEVRSAGTELHASRPGPRDGPDTTVAVQKLDVGGSTWELRVQPSGLVARRALGTGQGALWLLGGLFALVAGCLTCFSWHWITDFIARARSQGAALRQTREKLDGAMRQLVQAEKMTALGELVAGVAHEINNPLSTVMGYSQLLMRKEIPQDVRSRLDLIHSEAERMARIVKNLLAFARKQPPEKHLLGLNGVIEKTLDLKAYHFRVSQIRVVRDLAPDLPMTLLDFHQVQQVFLNLLNNAEQAMVEARKGGTIRLITRQEGDRIEARISDDGPGIPADVLPRVFEPFFTTKQEGKGTGLGLSLCYGVIHEHGGTIRAESAPGEGASFVLDFPILAAEEHPSGTPEASRPSEVSGLRILVIDDELGVQTFLVDLLRSQKHRADTAGDVPEALRKIAQNDYDLIISDMKMPHGSGRDVYEAVLARDPSRARRIIFTTGDGASLESRRFLEGTGNEIVLKPFQLASMEAAIARAIGTPAAELVLVPAARSGTTGG